MYNTRSNSFTIYKEPIIDSIDMVLYHHNELSWLSIINVMVCT